MFSLVPRGGILRETILTITPWPEEGCPGIFSSFFISSVTKPEISEYSFMSASERSPLARLVLFMTCLAIAGSIFSGVHYYAVDLPQQNALQAPENASGSTTSCATCVNNCKVSKDIFYCIAQCDLVCSEEP